MAGMGTPRSKMNEVVLFGIDPYAPLGDVLAVASDCRQSPGGSNSHDGGQWTVEQSPLPIRIASARLQEFDKSRNRRREGHSLPVDDSYRPHEHDV